MGQRLRFPRWKEGNTLHVSCDQIYTSSSIESHNVFNFLCEIQIFSRINRVIVLILSNLALDDLIPNDQFLKPHRDDLYERSYIASFLQNISVTTNCHIIEIFTTPISKDYKIKPYPERSFLANTANYYYN